ncbi:diacylglycerol kinase family protein [Streptomyces sp. HNM0645]|uniref:diacylglycerol/lipid kinase family protein n=1 Tax=Streptomyces sp. HNM0645 TaxID=2782343 RepID=UPI0024B698BA|nr:diacylglycerol kinase family protein [Streptomyces sp. HNM0645]MDI9885490.1 diacylglycerol kinase family protein [Streptomyces sp. HNM0645]
MDDDGRTRVVRSRRWSARLAILAAAAAVVLLVASGLGGIAMVLLVLAGTVVTAAALWWALTRRGPVRVLAVLLALAAPLTVIWLQARSGVLWVMVLCLVLGAVAASAGWEALALDARRKAQPTVAAERPARPFLIMNPRSGGGKVERFGLKAKAERAGAEVFMLDPERPSDVEAVARQAVADGADLLGVAGGDGTQALVAGVAAEHGVPFVVVPAGTRNHFALDLGLDRDDPSRALEALTDGVELVVDLGMAGDRVFVNNASFGAYALVVQSDAYRDDKVGTALQLFPDVLTHRAGPRLTVRAAGTTLDSPQAVLVSNNPYRAGDRTAVARRDRLDRGVLGVVSVTVESAAQAAGLLRGERSAGFTTLTAREVVVAADASEVQVGVDGEALTMPVPVRCTIRPGALRVRVPRHRPGVPLARPRLNWRRLAMLALAR